MENQNQVEGRRNFTASESYMVNIDVSETSEYLEVALTVAKYDGRTLTIVNTFNGIEAIDMWNQLVDDQKKVKKEPGITAFADNHGIKFERGNTNEQNASIETQCR